MAIQEPQNGALPMPPAVNVPAGWHPDPEGSGQLRYWDGSQWTGHFHPVVPVAPEPVSTAPSAPVPVVAMQSAPVGPTAPSQGEKWAGLSLAKYPMFWIALMVWGVAAVGGIALPFIVRAVQQQRTQNLMDLQMQGLSGEERSWATPFSEAGAAFESQMYAPIYNLWIVLAFIGLLGYALIIFLLIRGSKAARIVATVLAVLSIVTIFTAGLLSLPYVLLNLAGVALIWLRGSSEYLTNTTEAAMVKKVALQQKAYSTWATRQ